MTAGASRLSLAAQAGCHAIAVGYYGGALHNGHHFSSSGLQLESHRCSQPSKNLFPSRAVPPQLSACVTCHRRGGNHTVAHPQHSSPSQRAEPRMTERSVSQQVSSDTVAASPNKPAVSKRPVMFTPQHLGRRQVRSVYCISSTVVGLDRTPALSVWRSMPASEPETQDE